MAAWCTAQEVRDRVAGSPSLVLCQEYADLATSLLYDLSGRRFAGESLVESVHQVNRRGYIKLSMWQPVRDVPEVRINNVAVPFSISPAGTFVTVGLQHIGQMATLVIETGQNPPLSGKKAAAALGAHLLRGDARYRESGAKDVLPESHLSSISRQGVTYNYRDPADDAEKGLTGVDEADKFLQAVNPQKFRHQPKVVSVT